MLFTSSNFAIRVCNIVVFCNICFLRIRYGYGFNWYITSTLLSSLRHRGMDHASGRRHREALNFVHVKLRAYSVFLFAIHRLSQTSSRSLAAQAARIPWLGGAYVVAEQLF